VLISGITVMVAMPGDRMSTELRRRLQELLVERFRRRTVKPNHLKCDDRTASTFLRARFPVGHANCANFP